MKKVIHMNTNINTPGLLKAFNKMAELTGGEIVLFAENSYILVGNDQVEKNYNEFVKGVQATEAYKNSAV